MSLSINAYSKTIGSSRQRSCKARPYEGRWEGKAWTKKTRHKEKIIEEDARA